MKKLLLSAVTTLMTVTTLALPASASKPIKPVADGIEYCSGGTVSFWVRYSNGKTVTYYKHFGNTLAAITTDPWNNKHRLPHPIWVHIQGDVCVLDAFH